MYFRKRGYGQMHRQGKLLKMLYFFIVSRWSEDNYLRIMFLVSLAIFIVLHAYVYMFCFKQLIVNKI